MVKARSDRRIPSTRIPFPAACSVTLPNATTRDLTLVNLNMIGAYVAGTNAPTLGERVSLRFRLPDGESDMTLSAIVMWVKTDDTGGPDAPPGFGLQFVGSSLEESALLMRFVEQNLSAVE
jgi:Tfp pilus assembly protein PilZ